MNCPAFQEGILTQWFPYKDGQKLIFKSDAGLFDTITLNNTETTDAYEVTTGGYGNSTGDCSARKTFYSQEQFAPNIYKLYLNLSHYTPAYNQTSSDNVTMNLYKANMQGYNLKENGFERMDFNGSVARLNYSDNIQLDNKFFTNIQLAERDTMTSKNEGIHQIYFSRGKGVVAYRSFPSGRLWVLQ